MNGCGPDINGRSSGIACCSVLLREYPHPWWGSGLSWRAIHPLHWSREVCGSECQRDPVDMTVCCIIIVIHCTITSLCNFICRFYNVINFVFALPEHFSKVPNEGRYRSAKSSRKKHESRPITKINHDRAYTQGQKSAWSQVSKKKFWTASYLA